MASVTIETLSKKYAGSTTLAIDDVSLEVKDGEFLVLVGPSGCGKSSLLRSIAGLETIDSGRVLIGDVDVTKTHPGDRDIAMVFQQYALYPQYSVRRNLEYPLRIAKVPKAERNARVEEIAALLQIERLLDRRPSALSGGERQRVAMGRALIRKPAVFLMDEPLSNLDALLRVRMRSEISRLQRALGITTIYVTHDQVEAMTMGHRIALIRSGRIEQAGSPEEMYDRPATAYAAAFLGSPPMNLVSGALNPSPEGPGASPLLVADGVRLVLPGAVARVLADRGIGTGPIQIGFRPEDVVLESSTAESAQRDDLVVEGVVEVIEHLGAETLTSVALPTGHPERRSVDASTVFARSAPRRDLREGDQVRLRIPGDRVRIFSEEGSAVS